MPAKIESLPGVKVETSDEELFPTTTVETRGRTFKFRELTAEEYDSAVETSSHPVSDHPVTGEPRPPRLDTIQLLRWMIIKSSVEPKLSPADVAKLPLGMVGAIGKAVNDLHFGSEDLTPMIQQLELAGYKVIAPDETADEAPKGR